MSEQAKQDGSVFGRFVAATGRWPERPFLNVLPETAEAYGIAAGELTYGKAMAQIEALRAAYDAAGYPAGARVMMLLENRPAYVLHWFALNALGLSVVPVNPDLQAAELDYLAGHAEPVLALATESRLADLQGASHRSGVNFPVIAPDAELPRCGDVVDAARVEPSPQTEAAMLYTSGTTGNPKGCILSNTYFLNAGDWYAQTGGVCALTDDGERMITPLPMFHMNAMACSLLAIATVGGCLTVLDRFHPRSWWNSVRASRATCLHYLGVMPSILMKADAQPDDRDHCVRFGFGAGIDPKLQIPFEERFGIPLVEGWAMTETGVGATITANREPRKRGVSCLGCPEGEVEARVVTDDGQEAAANEPGELLVRRAGDDPRLGFFTAYYKDADATAEAWADGWFHTGDIVKRDAEGYFFFVDRKKNVIRRSGENIAAVEVETVLMQHPEIKAAAAAPAPDTLRGDEVFACLVVDGDRTEERARLIVSWCLEQMAYYKAPGYVAFVDKLPLTATQKIQRGVLKAEVRRLLDEGAAFDTRAMKERLLPT